MTTILAHIEIHAGKEEKWEGIMQDMVTETMKEEGAIRYEYFKGQKPNFYYCILAFVDKWAFYRHQNSDHHEGHDFADVLKSISLEYLDPVEDASPLPHTENPPLAPEMGDEMARTAKMYPTAMADWWMNRK